MEAREESVGHYGWVSGFGGRGVGVGGFIVGFVFVFGGGAVVFFFRQVQQRRGNAGWFPVRREEVMKDILDEDSFALNIEKKREKRGLVGCKWDRGSNDAYKP